MGAYSQFHTSVCNLTIEAEWLHSKRDALSSNRKVDGSRLTGSTEACHSWYNGNKDTGDGIASTRN